MKLILLSSEFPPGPGGIGDHAYNLAEQLVNNGFKVTVITEHRTEFANQWTCTFSATVKYAYRTRFLPNIHFFLIFLWYFAISRKTVWVASGSKSLMLLGLFMLLRPKKSLAILHGHELLEDTPARTFLIRMAIRQFNRAVAVSAFSLANSISHFPSDCISVIPNGINISKFKAFKPTERHALTSSLNLLTVGRLSRRKGQYNVIQALPLILKKYPQAVYHVVGLPDPENPLQELVNSLQLSDHVVFHGVLSNEQLTLVYAESDVFLMLSENLRADVEGFGIAIIEANYFGIPAIGSRGCGIEQAIEEGRTGRLVNYTRPEEVVNALEDILSRYPVYSNNARTWARNHDWTGIIEKYLSVIKCLS
jgi:glycosyltransferase involved in cell wall biosynthesis